MKKKKQTRNLKKISTLTSRGKNTLTAVEIAKKFFLPMSKTVAVPEGSSKFDALLDLFFNTATRHLNWYRVNESFDMPGEKYIAGGVTIAGTGKRRIEENELLLVVEDDNLEYVKIEVCRRKTQHNYRLLIHEWNFVKSKIRRV